MPIILNKQRVISTAPTPKQQWTRPSDWLDMPAMSQGDEKICMLVNVGEKSHTLLHFACQGAYTVDWGDGTTVQNFADDANAEHDFDWANISPSTLTSEGYRQCIVTITPQSGSQITNFKRTNSPHYHSEEGIVRVQNHTVCSVKMACPNLASSYLAFYFWVALEEFEFVGTSSINSTSNFFGGCSKLKRVISFDTSTVTNFGSMFSSCHSLLEVPALNTSNGTVFTSMFNGCTSIDYIPPMDVSSATTLNTMFLQCRNLTNVPITDFTGITGMSQTFSQTAIEVVNISLPDILTVHLPFDACPQLKVLNLTIPNNKITSLSYLARNCYNLAEVKLFDTSAVTNMQYAFYGCKRLYDFSWLDFTSCTSLKGTFGYTRITDASHFSIGSIVTDMTYIFEGCHKLEKGPTSIDATNMTSFQSSFRYCYKLKDYPTFSNTGNIINTYDMFGQNYNLTVAPNITGQLTNIRAMFNACYSLQTVPAYDLSAVGNYPSGYQFCISARNIRESLVTGMTTRHTYAGCNMSQSELVAVFNRLGTASGSQTIYVSHNPGSDDLTASDLLIATNKGWTVVN